jgi:hypothetical protein
MKFYNKIPDEINLWQKIKTSDHRIHINEN